ncbi:MAG: hypothetical protein CVV13_05660 [Gammaproteobacteria bacterium HGW-Gammaproteobacteria-3]|nr:MAG: hypothetical protein CVV13_05660 [Gammaproteobacteria bacterium HGW-Gammaproteobacteria-3]
MSTIAANEIVDLITAGIQAPSADNGQPWKFKLLDKGFELWLDPANMGLFFDVDQIATKISCGALLENVFMLAKAKGWSTDIDFLNESVRIARLNFTVTGKPAGTENAVRAAIFNRHSNRNLFRLKQKIPDNLLTELADVVSSGQNYRLHSYSSFNDRKAIIRTITKTDTLRFIHQQIHDDFYRVLRFGKAAEQTRDGLAAATLGIERWLLPLLQSFRPWKLTRLFNCIGLHHIMAFRGTWLPMKSSSRIVAIVHKGSVDYVESGRIMQRFWLRANELGLSVQALGALPLFLARLHLHQGEGFTPDQRKTLTVLAQDFARHTLKFDAETDQIVMLFRLGYARKPVTRSYRRPIASFLF